MAPRTSDTHPIRIDWLPEGLTDMPGRLGMTFAPGKCGPSAFGARWERDLAVDLDRIVDHYGANCLVTLLEESELTALGIPRFFEEVVARNLDVYWWKWPDATAPTGIRPMEALVDHLLCRVQNGERVVVHCRGGLGRTGTVVGSCLRALGFESNEAIELLRSARPDAIETSEQEKFVDNYDRRWSAKHPGEDRCRPREVARQILSNKPGDHPTILYICGKPEAVKIVPETEPPFVDRVREDLNTIDYQGPRADI